MTIHDYTIELCYELTKLRESNLELRQLLAAAVRANDWVLNVIVKKESPTIIVIANPDPFSNFVTITLGKEGE